MRILNIFNKKENMNVDFSMINSNEKAEKLLEKGQLEKLYLKPIQFGGKESRENIVIVPRFVTISKNNFDNIVEELLKKGIVSDYSAEPQYKGNSYVPTSIVISVSGKTRLTQVLEIWK